MSRKPFKIEVLSKDTGELLGFTTVKATDETDAFRLVHANLHSSEKPGKVVTS